MGKYFGTDGFRGVANKNLTAQHAYLIGRFIGFNNKGHKNKILVARDTRLSGQMLKHALISGIFASGGDVVDLDISTTPSVSYIVHKFNFDYGVMISASHNPYYDNGIKIFNKDGEKLSEDIELKIEHYIDNKDDDLPYAINENIGKSLANVGYIDDYLTFLVSKALYKQQYSKLHVLVDCANGSSSVLINSLVQKLNLHADIVNASPNGVNINDRCGSTHIELLREQIKNKNYDIAFAFDGDADRCLALNNKGEIINGDAIMFLNALNLKKHNKLKDNTIVLTVMSNIGLKKALKENNIAVKEVGVGDKYVQAEMKNFGYVLGGEQSGHIIFLNDMNTGSGLLTMIKVLDVIAEENKNVSELLKPLIIYPQCLKNVTVINKEAILSHTGFKDLENKLNSSLNGNGRILVRPSGTEPLIRVMVEAESLKLCEDICNQLVEYIEEIC